MSETNGEIVENLRHMMGTLIGKLMENVKDNMGRLMANYGTGPGNHLGKPWNKSQK